MNDDEPTVIIRENGVTDEDNPYCKLRAMKNRRQLENCRVN